VSRSEHYRLSVITVADRAVAEYGRLDTWVHMAGVLLVAGFDDTRISQLARDRGCPEFRGTLVAAR